MYERTFWLDHVRKPDNCFRIIDNHDGTISLEPAGTVMQEGVPQDQGHFNNIEKQLVSLDVAVGLLAGNAAHQSYIVENGTVELTNSARYPFNNSQSSVALSNSFEQGDYFVLCEVIEFSGNVGGIEIVDKLTNGFKIAYTGSAARAVIKYHVIGGFLNEYHRNDEPGEDTIQGEW